MKKIIYTISAIAAAAMMLSACAKEESKQAAKEGKMVEVHFRATQPETKVAFDEADGTTYPTLWESDDAIGISVNAADVVTSSSITLANDGANADFTASLTDDGSGSYTLWALSPASKITNTEIQSEKNIYLNVPSTQTPTATSPDPKAIVIGGIQTVSSLDEDINIEFQHLGAYLHLVLKGLSEGETVSSVYVESDAKLAGSALVEFTSNPSLKSRSAVKNLTINPKGVSANSDGEADIWAGVFRGDSFTTITVTVTTGNATYDAVTIDLSSASYKLKAGEIAKVNVDLSGVEAEREGKYSIDFSGWEAATKNATYTSADGSASIVTTASGSKFRGDVKSSSSIVLHAGNYPYLAVRMNLVGDSRNVTIDGVSEDETYKGALGNGANKKLYAADLSDGSVVWVYNLASQKWGNTSVLPTDEAVTFTTFQVKYADIVADSAPTWTLYDVQTFASLDEVNTAYETSFSAE